MDTGMIGYHLARNWEKYGLVGVGAGLGWAPTRAATWTAVTWTTTQVVKPIAVGMTIAAANVARVVLLPIITGYLAGAVIGTIISEQMYGESGKEDAISLYTGQVSWDEYWSTVGEGLEIFWNDL